jgi:hypothetical protein
MIPAETKRALVEWVHHGNKYEHGSFIMALVTDSLLGAFKYANDEEGKYIRSIVRWVSHHMPEESLNKEWQGMPDNEFITWVKKRGL